MRSFLESREIKNTSMNTSDENLKVLAFHEAGHAVVSWSLMIPLKEIRIDPSGGICLHSLSIISSLDPVMMSNSDWIRVEIKAQILLGGEITERVAEEMAWLNGDDKTAELFRDAREIGLESTTSIHDREELNELIQLCFGNFGTESVNWINKIEAKTESIITDNWEKICAVGNALINKRILSGYEATQIIRES